MKQKTLAIIASLCLATFSLAQSANREYAVFANWFKGLLPRNSQVQNITPQVFTDTVVSNITSKETLAETVTVMSNFVERLAANEYQEVMTDVKNSGYSKMDRVVDPTNNIHTITFTSANAEGENDNTFKFVINTNNVEVAMNSNYFEIYSRGTADKIFTNLLLRIEALERRVQELEN